MENHRGPITEFFSECAKRITLLIEEDWTPDSVKLSMQVDDFVYISDGAYTKQQLLAMVINHFHLHFNEQQCFPIIIPFLSFNLLIEAKLEPKVFLLSPCSYRHFTALDTQPISAQHFCISKCRNEQY